MSIQLPLSSQKTSSWCFLIEELRLPSCVELQGMTSFFLRHVEIGNRDRIIDKVLKDLWEKIQLEKILCGILKETPSTVKKFKDLTFTYKKHKKFFSLLFRSFLHKKTLENDYRKVWELLCFIEKPITIEKAKYLCKNIQNRNWENDEKLFPAKFFHTCSKDPWEIFQKKLKNNELGFSVRKLHYLLLKYVSRSKRDIIIEYILQQLFDIIYLGDSLLKILGKWSERKLENCDKLEKYEIFFAHLYLFFILEKAEEDDEEKVKELLKLVKLPKEKHQQILIYRCGILVALYGAIAKRNLTIFNNLLLTFLLQNLSFRPHIYYIDKVKIRIPSLKEIFQKIQRKEDKKYLKETFFCIDDINCKLRLMRLLNLSNPVA